jgi:hypothetical protein
MFSLSGKIAIVLLLSAHVALLGYSMRWQFATRNEVAHVPAGISCWETGRFSLYRVNPPLWRMLAVLPVLWYRPNTECIQFTGEPGIREEWGVAAAFADANRHNYHELICLARLAGIMWSVLGAGLVFCWSRDLYGGVGAFLALAIWCFEPNVLAHAQLATPDMPATVSGLAATYAYWKYLGHRDATHLIFAGLLLGIAQLTKFTLLVLYPVWALLAILYSFRANSKSGTCLAYGPVRDSIRRCRYLVSRLTFGAVTVCLSVLVINMGYAFDQTGVRLGDYQFVSRLFRGDDAKITKRGIVIGNRFQGSWLARVPVPFPADYVNGIDVQRRDLEGPSAPSYLAGEWRPYGVWYYYLYALAVKAPVGILILAACSLGLVVCGHKASALLLDELTLWLPVLGVLMLVSSHTDMNRHMRYVLPIFPFAIVATGKLAYFFERRHWVFGLAVGSLLAWAVASSLMVYPHSLSYFNEFAGGPNKGYMHLLNSNIDWGQDLFYLKDWVRSHPEACPLGLAYHNYIDYRICGAKFSPVPPDPPIGRQGTAWSDFGPHPGWFALDLYSLTRGPYNYFEFFQPVAKAGYSIFIYHITVEEATAARKALGLEPL